MAHYLYDIDEVNDGYFHPAWGTVKDSSFTIFSWSASSKSEQHIESFKEYKSDDEPLDAVFIAYNNSYNNIYHITREWIAALLVYKFYNFDKLKIPVILPYSFDNINYFNNDLILSAINLLDIKPYVVFIKTNNPPLKAKRIIYPRILSGCFYKSELTPLSDFLGSLARSITKDDELVSDRMPNSILYISRCDSSKRRVVNECELINHLHCSYNADIISLSGKSLYQKVSVINNYSLIISPHGAGLANICFAYGGDNARRISVIELMPTNYDHEFFKIICGEKNIDYYKVYTQLYQINNLNNHDSTYKCSIESIVDIISKIKKGL